jgi:hypothetical protein
MILYEDTLFIYELYKFLTIEEKWGFAPFRWHPVWERFEKIIPEELKNSQFLYPYIYVNWNNLIKNHGFLLELRDYHNKVSKDHINNPENPIWIKGWAKYTNKTEAEVRKYFFLGVEEGKKINKIEKEKHIEFLREEQKKCDELHRIMINNLISKEQKIFNKEKKEIKIR